MAVSIGNDWDDILKGELDKQYFKDLQSFLDKEYMNKKVNPRRSRIYRALKLTPFEDVKVVIVGQDPYYGPNQNLATGLAFSLPHWMTFSTEKKDVESSTKYIYKLLKKDLNYDMDSVQHGCLESWTEQGVLLLNAILTVRQGEPLSHEEQGWTTFTDAIIRELSERKEAMVFILWGEIAREKQSLINERHHVINAPHPKAKSKEKKEMFLESNSFSAANKWLKERNVEPVNWELPLTVKK